MLDASTHNLWKMCSPKNCSLDNPKFVLQTHFKLAMTIFLIFLLILHDLDCHVGMVFITMRLYMKCEDISYDVFPNGEPPCNAIFWNVQFAIPILSLYLYLSPSLLLIEKLSLAAVHQKGKLVVIRFIKNALQTFEKSFFFVLYFLVYLEKRRWMNGMSCTTCLCGAMG
jgi:hypothetical protein